MEYNSVKIGDKFYRNPNSKQICEVVDFISKTSMKTGNILEVYPIAKILTDLSTGNFETSFTTVKRNKI